MSITPLSFPDFIDTTADEQRWQLFNSVASGVEISNDVGNPIPVVAVASATSIPNYYHNISAASTNDTLVSAGKRVISLISIFHIGTGSVNRFFKLYDKTTTPTSSDTPIFTFAIHPSDSVVLCPPIPIAFNNGIGYRMTANYPDNDNTAISANELVVNISYI